MLVLQHVFRRKSILMVRRHAAIGDIICTLPSVASLRQGNPKAVIVYETGYAYMALVRCFRDVDLVVEGGSWLAKLLQKVVKPERSFHPLLPDELQPPRTRSRIHLTEEFRKCFGLETLSEESVPVEIPARALRLVQRRLQRERLGGKSFVVIHAGPSWKVKEWPERYWRDLVAELKIRHMIEVIQIGEDRTSFGESSESPRTAGARDWVGTLRMDQTLALLSLADLFVGIDSGVLHMAGAVDTPCVGIFGPTDPLCFLPRNSRAAGVTSNVTCLGCHHDPQGPKHWKRGCPNDIRCMSELTAEKVFSACNQILDGGRNPVLQDCCDGIAISPGRP